MLPHVIVTVTDDQTGALDVTVDQQPVNPPAGSEGWRRDDLATILDTLTSERDQPLRVEVRESDGSRFTDILTPPRRRSGPSDTSQAPGAGGFRGIVTGAGFIPGEQVTVAVAVLTTSAGPTGTARAWLSLAHTTQPAGEVVLIGRISGTVTTATRGEPGDRHDGAAQ
ncbi:hypothetical protein SAMN04488561_1439 [Jiangella alba]|uniref:Uncharacterized protein n=1 Tax=Jiangella alba TaxID=561176 RepID=A0A1H5J4G0_9ACTN|nr:hypothetical protein SAMN04488561_1439 [Jiangella alba]